MCSALLCPPVRAESHSDGGTRNKVIGLFMLTYGTRLITQLRNMEFCLQGCPPLTSWVWFGLLSRLPRGVRGHVSCYLHTGRRRGSYKRSTSFQEAGAVCSFKCPSSFPFILLEMLLQCISTAVTRFVLTRSATSRVGFPARPTSGPAGEPGSLCAPALPAGCRLSVPVSFQF